MPGETARQNGMSGGRPKGSLSKKTLEVRRLRARLAERVAAKADAIFDAWEDLALGHYVMVKNPLTGEQRVYKKGPNGLALKDMLEQVWGKPRQPIDINVEDEPRYDIEALQRMAKYVEPTDAEFTELNAGATSLRISAIPPTKAFEIYSLRGVGQRLAARPANPTKGLDKDHPKEQGQPAYIRPLFLSSTDRGNRPNTRMPSRHVTGTGKA